MSAAAVSRHRRRRSVRSRLTRGAPERRDGRDGRNRARDHEPRRPRGDGCRGGLRRRRRPEAEAVLDRVLIDEPDLLLDRQLAVTTEATHEGEAARPGGGRLVEVGRSHLGGGRGRRPGSGSRCDRGCGRDGRHRRSPVVAHGRRRGGRRRRPGRGEGRRLSHASLVRLDLAGASLLRRDLARLGLARLGLAGLRFSSLRISSLRLGERSRLGAAHHGPAPRAWASRACASRACASASARASRAWASRPAPLEPGPRAPEQRRWPARRGPAGSGRAGGASDRRVSQRLSAIARSSSSEAATSTMKAARAYVWSVKSTSSSTTVTPTGGTAEGC